VGVTLSTILNTVASYLSDLSATSAVVTAFGTTLVFGTNMFIGGETATETNTLSILPYGGSPPDIDGNRQNPAIQIRTRTTSRYSGLEVQQALINTLHTNELGGAGKMFAVQSCPIPLDTELGGRYVVYVSNYQIKHVKV